MGAPYFESHAIMTSVRLPAPTAAQAIAAHWAGSHDGCIALTPRAAPYEHLRLHYRAL